MAAAIRCVAASMVLLAGCGGGGGGGSVSISAFGVNGTAAPAPPPAANPPPPAPPASPMVVKVTELASGLNSPWGLAFLPDGKLLVTQRGGQMRLRNGDGTPVNGGADQVSGVPVVEAVGQGGLLDVVVDPAFASNRRIYFSYSERDTGNASLNSTAVARAELDVAGRSLSNFVVIYRQLPRAQSNAHFGSRLVFDRNGYLFVTLGERMNTDQRGFAQDLTRGHGKVMRITTDGVPAPGNPDFGVAGAQPHIWSYGHRNVQGAALHPATGDLWVNEHGPQGGDEVNLSLPGRNYGWPVISYGQEYGTLTQVGDGTAKAGMEQPLTYWEKIDGSAWTPGTAKSSIAPSGMAFYTGDALPDWKDSLFVGALAGTALWRLTLNGNTVTGRERLLADRGERIRDVRQGPDGWIYLLTDSANGKLLRLQR
ncbi:PQQ-dependent sugar dehydrogenase [Variovorax sp. LjRoot84]|uniref:PQQ-dependent sugar dehydrogenase n=1 Tax=Variovorax sp. LjRoot84 TaxID=3342340 RepID=UPI003ECF06B2